MDLAVQIVNFNTREHLVPCLRSIAAALAQTAIEARVLVLENGSDDDLGDLRGGFGPAVEFHDSETNLGFGGGHNLLARRTAAPYLCFVNPDCVVPAGDVFERLLACFADPAVAAAGPMLLDGAGRPQRWDHGELHGLRARISNGAGEAYWRPRWTRADAAWVSGAFLTIRRAAFERAGGFDERFFLYKEEEDLCLRIRRDGGRVLYEPAARVTHIGSVVAKRRPELFRPSVEHYLHKNFPRRWRRRVLRALYLGWARRG